MDSTPPDIMFSQTQDDQDNYIPNPNIRLFMQDNEFYSTDKYVNERLFREKVLDFLYDGKPKLFKSTQEGNMIIKLTDISLTPLDNLGRMLYSFSATGSEIDDNTFVNYQKYDLLI